MEWVSKRERLAVCLHGAAVVALALLLPAVPVRAFAADIELPVPAAVVYPGQSVADKGVSLARFRVPVAKLASYVVEEAMLTDRVARRTLLPNQPILLSDLKSPDVVRAGVPAAMIYREGGVFISGLGTPLASAGPGDAIRVRNTDSGITVSGIVQADGSIEVGSQ
jgi:flagellar basal body P-ring formation protein FlgA